jgi:hypothetical protein
MHDDKQSSYVKGWIKHRKDIRKPLNLPPGYEMAHKRGFEASKGYSYKHSDPQWRSIHDIQHKHDKMGLLNKDRGKK